MNDKYVTQDDLEMDRRVTTLESEFTSTIRSFNLSLLLLIAVAVGSAFLNYTAVRNLNDFIVDTRISILKYLAEFTEQLGELSEELEEFNTRL